MWASCAEDSAARAGAGLRTGAPPPSVERLQSGEWLPEAPEAEVESSLRTKPKRGLGTFTCTLGVHRRTGQQGAQSLHR